ncbi:MAG: EAL domain-containing protein [Sideroxydans sp.]|jgi:diguanylate cyclase (GGDEF)-like protein/PAS domain S-box-containing protein
MSKSALSIMRALLAFFALFALSTAFAADHTVRIGVLSFRPLEQTQAQWRPMADYLNARIPEHHFSIRTLYYKDLDLAVARHEFDFVLTNPEHYIALRAQHNLSAVATLMPLVEGHPVTRFGGVIFTRSDRAGIRTLNDLAGKVAASPAEHSLGGYLMQRWMLYKEGVGIEELDSVYFTGMPHDKVVTEVLEGRADVGFIRTGILESMVREGKLKWDSVKLINRQPEGAFPQQYSTDLYPEWPIAAMPELPSRLVKRVTLALLHIGPHEEVAKNGGFFGFAPAENYAAVEAMLVSLKLNPDRAQAFDLRDVMRKYAIESMSIGLLVLLAMVTAALYLARQNRLLRSSDRERARLDEDLRLANASLEEKVALRTQELRESELRFRHMFERHSSPMLLIEPSGGEIVDANQAACKFYGYVLTEMQGMNIAHINTLSPEEVAEERRRAKQQERNYFVFQHRLADGDSRTVEVYSSPVDVEGRSLLFSIIHDITERKSLEDKMHDLAFYDPLTRLPNRRLLLDRLGMALNDCARTRRYGALLFLDLDHFKMLNDLHGHDVGDQLLVEVSDRILNCIREQDSAARFGGDEFVVMLEGLSEHMTEAVVQAEVVAEKIRESLAKPYSLKHLAGALVDMEYITHHCSSSIGVTLFRDQVESLEQLLKWTDMAMYRAKEAGRNTIRFFDPEMQTAIELRATLENDLRVALEQGQFQLFYQVQVNANRRPQGAEVLLRWLHPERGMVSPAQFIPLAEETGLILPIGAWVLDTACAQIKRWERELPFRDLTLAVNVSAKQFRQPDFVAQVQSMIARHGINPMSLKLELTESLVLDDVGDTITKMRALKDIGVMFSMDDFGTGYSSLSYLKRLPLSQLKIDQSFVHDLATDFADMVMVMTIVDLGMNFEVDVIAEGVETEAQFKLLHRYGCASFQGYLFSKPVPVAEFEAVVTHYFLK